MKGSVYMNCLCYSFGAIVLALFFLQQLDPELESALATLQTEDRSVTKAEQEHAAGVIRARANLGDRGVWERLKGIIIREEAALSVRQTALRLACEKADGYVASEILSVMYSVARRLDVKRIPEPRSDHIMALVPEALMTEVFLSDGVKHLKDLLDQEGVMQFLVFVASHTHPAGANAPWLAMEVISTGTAPIELRRASAVKVIRQTPRRTAAVTSFLSLLDASSLAELRACVRHPQDPAVFHFHAAATLAESGDEEILGDLKTWREKLSAQSPSFVHYIDAYMWKIEIQHPPTRLTEYIAGTDPRPGRAWAISRAVALGIDKLAVREAILRYAQNVAPQGAYNIRPGLQEMKRVGLDLRILREDDLPDVVLRDRRPTP